jgi:WD40 repeat protein
MDMITVINFFPIPNNLILGTSNGKILIYSFKNNVFRYNYSFKITYKKITGIYFINKKEILLTSNDSKIKLINLYDGEVIKKFKGFLNNGNLKADYNENIEKILIGSEDGYIYLFNINNNLKSEKIKIFKKKKEFITNALFLNENNVKLYKNKINEHIDLYFSNIIICTSSKGNIKIILYIYKN